MIFHLASDCCPALPTQPRRSPERDTISGAAKRIRVKLRQIRPEHAGYLLSGCLVTGFCGVGWVAL